MAAIKIFYSYSHKDERFQEKLETHLSILQRNGHIEGWHDRRISAGHDWEEEINLNLEEADIILLLVSSNFLASEYCYDTETIRALEKHAKKEAVVIPVIVTPCLWLESKLKSLQSLPRNNKPITTWANEDEAWLEVANSILHVVRDLQENRPVRTKKKVIVTSKDLRTDELVYEFLMEYSQ